MSDLGCGAVLQGIVFDYLGLLIAVLSIIQIVWHLFARE
jgi:hypothetical protein